MRFNKSLIEIGFLAILAIRTASFLRLNLINSKTSYSEALGNTSHAAVDGNIETCLTAEIEKNDPWWRVELDRIHIITDISILFTPERAYTIFMNNLNIYVANSAKEMEEHLCISFKGSTSILSVSYIQLKCDEPVSGKFVTIKRIGGIRKDMLLLCEVAVNAERGTVNLAYKRPTFHNGILFKNTSELAVDNNLQTCSVIKAHEEVFAWWRVVLDDRYYITDVNIHFARNVTGVKILKVAVYVSSDDTYFEDHKCGNTSNANNGFVDAISVNVTCNRPILGMIVTIKKYGKSKPKWLQLCEVEIFSKKDRQEKDIPAGHRECLNFQYKCREGKCIHNDWLCDGTEDCPHGDDEAPSCQTCDAGKFKCARRNMCVENIKRCDGIPDCLDFFDEKGCITTDLSNDFVKATYKGESDYFMCSHAWIAIYSYDFCKKIHSSPSVTAKTFYEPIKDEPFKFLKVKTAFADDSKLPDMDEFGISSNCESGTYVKIQCQHQNDEVTRFCGTRGFPDGDLEPYIVNGEDAKTGAWPWNVQIFYNAMLSCGGSIINETWVLTAAHCLEDKRTSDMYIKVGTNVLNDPLAQKFYISHFESHPKAGLFNDIALIRLDSPIKFTKFVRPICLPYQRLNRRKLMTFRYCVLSGFGRTVRDDRTKPKYMQQGRMNILLNNDCGNYLDTIGLQRSMNKQMLDNNNLLCAGSIPLTSGINACLGDSGSPLVCKDENRIWTQVGVATNEVRLQSGVECSSSIFVKLDRYMDFVNKAMNSKIFGAAKY